MDVGPPLVRGHPTEIVAELPAVLSGESAELRVFTGVGVESNAITLQLYE